jgi:hypothetical protein
MAMVMGTADRPFVYRALLPFLVAWLTPLLPLTWAQAITQLPFIDMLCAQFHAPDYPREVLWMMLGMYFALMGFLWALRYLMRVVGFTEWARTWVPVIALILLPMFYLYGKLYDLPALFLFTLAFALLIAQRWKLYLLVFAVGTLNKETMILIALIFAVYGFRRLPKAPYWGLLALQLLVFALIKGGLNWYFQNNPGSVVEMHLDLQWQAFWLSPFDALIWGVLLALGIGYRWAEKPVVLRYALVILVPLVISHVFLGMPYEIRVYLEAYPILLLLSVGALFKAALLYNAPPPTGRA